MELVEGKSLFQMQREGYRFDWREILNIAKDVGQALRHAHDRGVIHRDLKPGNLLRSNTGENKITDFGIAKSFGSSQNTGENVLGTMDFMSPEQAKGQPVTARSDLYSLGTVLFTLLSGKPPFKSNSVEESLRNLTKVPPPHVSSLAPDVPLEIDKLIRQLMDKDPNKRIPTAHALLVKIAEIEQQLKDYSEAKTACNPPVAETFEIREPGVAPITEKQHDNSQRAKSQQTVQKTTIDGRKERAEFEAKKQADFFSTVTEQQRQRQAAGGSKKPPTVSRGTIPLLICLLAVIVIGGYGLRKAFTAPPADALYAKIENSSQAPDLVRDEIAQFIKAYPEDERIASVKQLDGIAKSIALSNNLTVRSRMANNRLSEIERQYLDIVDLAGKDPPAAFSRMNAFLTLHGDSPELSPEDETCVAAARDYLVKIENDARHKVDFNRTKINMALERAAEQGNPADARKIYQSIVELYRDSPWAEDLVQAARHQLDSLDLDQQ
jgi:serine/threonine-protein kinase